MAAHQRRLRQLGRQLGSGRAAPAAAATAATEDAASVEGHAARMAELFELLAPIAAEAGVSEEALVTARSILLEAVAEDSYDPTILGPYSVDMMPPELRGLVAKGVAGLDRLLERFSLQRPTPPAPPKRLWDQRPVVRKAVGQPEGAIPVLVPANSCMIFDRRLWHAQSPNYSQAERLVLFMGYGARWLKARDAMYVEDAMAMTTCPLRRQMLGYTTQNSGLYHVRAVYFALSCAGSLANPKAPPPQIIFAARTFHAAFPYHLREPRLSVSCCFRTGRERLPTLPEGWRLGESAKRLIETAPEFARPYIENYTSIDGTWKPASNV